MVEKRENFDLRDFLPYLLNQAADATSLEFQRYYKDRYGMLRTEWRVLFHLGRYGVMTAKEVCNRSSIHKTKVSRAVGALVDKRFVDRAEVPDDRRHELLSLTPVGHKVFNYLNVTAQQYDLKLSATFSEAEAAVLRRCLIKISGF